MTVKISAKNFPRLNDIWRGIKGRCYSPNHTSYPWYGAKGVKMCDEWKNSFKSFAKWAIYNGYEVDLTIDRLDSSKDYQPDNCRWITQEENTRLAHIGQTGRQYKKAELITFNGKTQAPSEWANELGIEYATLQARLRSPKWTVEEALTIPTGGKPNGELLTFQGATKPLSEWAKEIGVSHDTLYQRLHRLDWSVEKALTYKTRTRKPSNPKDAKDLLITFNGKTQNLAEWSKELDIPYYTLYQRLYKLDWSEEKALTKAVRQKRSS